MKLVTFAVFGEDKVGVYTEQGVVDLKFGCKRYFSSQGLAVFSSMRSFLASGDSGITLAKEIMQKVLEIEGKNLSSRAIFDSCIVREGYRLRPPLTNPEKILCPAVNYAEHGKEDGATPPTEPYFFGKFSNTLIGQDDAVILPRYSRMPDYEVELAAVIGKRCKHVSAESAYDYIAGYTILNDISLRDLQGWPNPNPRYGPNWLMAKSADTACPLGPWIVTRDELQNPYPLRIKLSINGLTRQDSDTSKQLFKIPELVSYLTRTITLEPGDIISTGTPSGVGRTTGNFLKEDDIIEAEIEKIGILRNSAKMERSG